MQYSLNTQYSTHTVLYSTLTVQVFEYLYSNTDPSTVPVVHTYIHTYIHERSHILHTLHHIYYIIHTIHVHTYSTVTQLYFRILYSSVFRIFYIKVVVLFECYTVIHFEHCTVVLFEYYSYCTVVLFVLNGTLLGSSPSSFTMMMIINITMTVT